MGCGSKRYREEEIRAEQKWDYIVGLDAPLSGK